MRKWIGYAGIGLVAAAELIGWALGALLYLGGALSLLLAGQVLWFLAWVLVVGPLLTSLIVLVLKLPFLGLGLILVSIGEES